MLRTQHLLTLFIRRPDDGPVRAETCSLIYNKYDVLDIYKLNKKSLMYNKYDVLDVNGFNIIFSIVFNTSGCPQSKKKKITSQPTPCIKGLLPSYNLHIFLLKNET